MFAPNLQDPYNFAAEPRAVKARTKYREAKQEEEIPVENNTNIMWDRRVARGNTYAPVVQTATKQFSTSLSKSAKKSIKPLETTVEYESAHADVSTPRPVPGRKHTEVQTEDFVELLTDKPPEFEKDAQTDFYIDRPVNRLFVPQKIGEDKETQVLEGELFDFDYEVEPILQVLIGKTLEQGRMEVLEEEETRVMKEEQKRYDELRYAELSEAQKMEAEEKRTADESDRRRKQHRLYQQNNVTSHKKLVCRVLAKEYFKNVVSNSFAILREQGTFRNAFDFEITNSLVPWINNDVLHIEEGRKAIARTIKSINDTISHALKEMHEKSIREEAERKKRVQEEKDKNISETKERRRQRGETRKARDEEERLRVLKAKIADTLISRGEQRQGIFAQALSDIDSLGREGNTVGLLGGTIGEMLVVLSTLNDFKQIDANDPLAALANIEITEELVRKVVDQVVDNLVKEGKIDIGVTGDAEARLAAINPELNLTNLHTVPDKAEEIREVLRESINSSTLDTLQQNASQLGLNSEHLKMLVDAFINHILSPEEKARKVRVFKAPIAYNEDVRADALVILMPNIEESRPFNLSEAKGIKSSKRRRGSRKDSMNGADEIKMDDVAEKIVTAAEVELEDAVNVFPLQNEELRVMVHQRAASVSFRREVLLFLGSQIKELDMKEIEVLKRVNNKADSVEEIVAAKFTNKLPIFTYEKP